MKFSGLTIVAPAEPSRRATYAAGESATEHEGSAAGGATPHGSSHIIGRVQIAVIGSGAEWTAQAEEVGRLLGERGCVVVCGGLGEVMEAAARGAKNAGGTTIGILPGESPNDANPWIDYRGRDRDGPRPEPGRRRLVRGGGRGRRQVGDACRGRVRPRSSAAPWSCSGPARAPRVKGSSTPRPRQKPFSWPSTW